MNTIPEINELCTKGRYLLTEIQTALGHLSERHNQELRELRDRNDKEIRTLQTVVGAEQVKAANFESYYCTLADKLGLRPPISPKVVFEALDKLVAGSRPVNQVNTINQEGAEQTCGTCGTQTPRPKPSLGPRPHYIWKMEGFKERIAELEDAINRRLDQAEQPPVQWLLELRDVKRSLEMLNGVDQNVQASH
jgi:hypothetical protein